MAARGMEGLSDLWKVTLLKKDSFVPASPFPPASASTHSTFGVDRKRLGCLTQNKGLSNDVVILSIWEFRLSISVPKGVLWAHIFCLGCPHCEFQLCLNPLRTEAAGRKTPILFLSRPQLEELFGEVYGDKQTSLAFVLDLSFLEFQHRKRCRGPDGSTGLSWDMITYFFLLD